MSWYVNFYIGIMDKEDKIRPLGPFNNDGELCCVRSTSRSFTTELHERFNTIRKTQYTDELCKHFEYDTNEENGFAQYLGYLELDELPKGSYIKKGYFLIEQVIDYLETGEADFRNTLTQEQYAFKLDSELKFGPPKPKKDDYGEEIIEYSCADYTYFAYPEYQSEEYESSLLRTVAGILKSDYDLKDGEKIVVIKTEG